MAYFRVPTTDKVKGLLNRRGRLEKIIDLVSSLPSSPNQGDRYIDLSDNKIKEYDGSVWQEYVPNEGDNLYVLNRDKYYYFDGSNWKDLTEIASQWDKSGDTLTPKDADNIEINGSFVGDGSQLTGIKKLIEEFVAQGNVTAGDVVAFVNGKVKKGKTGSTNEIEDFGNEYVFNNGYTNYTSCSALSDSKFVVCYSDVGNNNYGTAVIGEVSGNTITFGSEYVFNNASTVDTSCSALLGDKFVVCYTDGGNNNDGTAVIGEVSGNTITFGSEYVFDSTGFIYSISCSALSDSKFVVCYKDKGNSDYGTAVIGEVSGNTITFGSQYVFNNASTVDISCSALLDNKFVVCYRDYGNNYGTAVIGEVSGNTITFGSEYVFNNSNTYSISCSALLDNKFVVCYSVGNNYLGTAVIGEVSGNTITFGSQYVFNNADTSEISCSALSNNKFVVCYKDVGNSDYGTAVIGEVSGNTITFGSEYVFNNADIIKISCSALLDNKFVVCYRGKGNSDYGTAVIGELQQNEYNYIGVSQETKNDGETSKVLIQGVSDVHFGLTVEQKYYADENGNLTTTETEDYIGVAISENKILLLDWQRPIMIYDGSNDEYIVPEKI